jgi:hypothetical protein
MKVLGKSFYIAAGATLAILGSVGLWKCYEMVTQPIQEAKFDILRKEVLNECSNYARLPQFKFRTTTKNEDSSKPIVEVKANGFNDWELKFTNASMIVERCEGFELKSFCMGEECNDNGKKHRGIIMELEYNSDNEVLVSKK